MIRSMLFKNLAVALTVGISGLVMTGAPARGGDVYEPACHRVVYYVTTYEAREVTRVRYVTVYDRCGRPYRAARTCTEVVEVPVMRPVVVYP